MLVFGDSLLRRGEAEVCRPDVILRGMLSTRCMHTGHSVVEQSLVLTTRGQGNCSVVGAHMDPGGCQSMGFSPPQAGCTISGNN